MFECPATRAGVHTSQPLSPNRVRNVCRIEFLMEQSEYRESRVLKATDAAISEKWESPLELFAMPARSFKSTG